MNGPDQLDPRVAELLSAHVDGELAGDERAAAEAWIERSPAARAEHDSLAAVKAAVHGLPAVDPPAGFFEAMLERGSPAADAPVVPLAGRRRGRPAAWVGAAVAAAAAWIVVAGADVDAVTPPVDEVESALASGRAASLRPVTAVPADGVPVAVRAGGKSVAIARLDGEPDWDDLPSGDRDRHRGDDVWVDLTAPDGVARVVVARGLAVYTLVSEEADADELVDLAADLPEADDGSGPLGRIRRASEALLEAVGLD